MKTEVRADSRHTMMEQTIQAVIIKGGETEMSTILHPTSDWNRDSNAD